MDRFQALTAFARVVETGSFARAAERLGVSVSSVSRLVADLEAHLDARLLNRTTRRLSLTETGQAFFERCVQLLADLEEAEVAVSSASIVPRGTLRLTCSATFATRHLAPAIAAFAARHPQMRFDVELSERVVDIVEEGFDLAVRVGTSGSQNLVGRLDRHDADRLLRRAILSRPPRRAEGARRPRAACLPHLRIFADPQRLDVPRSQTGASARCGSRVRCTRTTAVSTKRSRSRASASRASPISSSARTCARDDLRRYCVGSSRRRSTSTSCIRAAAICRPRSGRSRISWSSALRHRSGVCPICRGAADRHAGKRARERNRRLSHGHAPRGTKEKSNDATVRFDIGRPRASGAAIWRASRGCGRAGCPRSCSSWCSSCSSCPRCSRSVRDGMSSPTSR